MKMQPSIVKIVQSDYASLLCVLGPAITIVMAVVATAMGGLPGRRGGTIPAETTYWVAGVATALLVPIFLYRVSSVRRVFATGVEVQGKITEVAFMKDRGTVAFGFELEGRTFTVSRALSKNSRTERLRVGDTMTVVVDPMKPTNAFLRDLYV